MIETTNWNNQAASAFPFFSSEKSAVVNVEPQRPSVSSRPIFSIEACLQIELSLVPEIEAVIVERNADGEFRVISVVNERDAAIRDKVYAREEEIMAIYPGVRFDFHVLARMNRRLDDLISKVGKIVFER
ncbi:MAG: hypothetical protein DMG40_04430 [Acidobacteria bacterium]|nr:MAG: hypothetical protein DMG40_04430 [Acidobacteriota bacterium]